MPFLNRISSIQKEVISSIPPITPTFSASIIAGSYVISQPNNALLFNSLNELSIELYFRVSNFNASFYCFILSFANSGSTANNGIQLATINDGRFIALVPNRITQETAVNIIQLNTWHHVCVQCNSSSNQLSIFIDGVNRSQRSHSNLFSNFTNNRVVINSASATSFSEVFFNGNIGDVRVSNILRYNSGGFTRPSSPLQNDINTLLLLSTLNSNDVITDKSSNNISFTKIGSNITFSSLTPYT